MQRKQKELFTQFKQLRTFDQGETMTKEEVLKLALEALKQIDEAMPFPVAKLAQASIKEALAQPERDYERGFIDGMQKQMQSSVDKAVNAMTQPTYYIPNKDERTWVGLTAKEKHEFRYSHMTTADFIDAIEAKLKDKNTRGQE